MTQSAAASVAPSSPELHSPPVVEDRKFGRWLMGAALALVLLKQWLVSAQLVHAVGVAQYDDRLFLELARNILHGDWLGPYGALTLAKGPMYSIFIAAVFLTGIPLLPAQHLVYAAACGIMVRALRPLAPHRGVRFALFAVLLFNPVTYDSIIHTGVLRQALLYSEVLVVIGGFVGLLTRRNGSIRVLLGWAVLTGSALAAFWLTREEGVWLLPAVALVWGAALALAWRERTPDRRMRLLILITPSAFWCAGLLIVATLNYRHYGLFTTCEFNCRDFKDAYGALLRVTPEREFPYMHVTRETRERIYAVSPAFAKLRSQLEGPIGEGWAGLTESITHLPASEREIAGGWFMWALRRAVFETGQGKNGAEIMAYYRRLAAEINDACDRGLLKSGPPRSGFLPPFQRKHLDRLPDSLRKVTGFFVSFERMEASTQWPSVGPQAEFQLFADLTRGRMSPLEEQTPLPPQQRWLDRIRLNLLQKILHGYQFAAPWVGSLGLLAWLTAVGLAVWRRRWNNFGLLGAGLIGSCLAILLIVALIDVTSFPAVTTAYFAGAYALWLLLMFAGWLAVVESLRTPKNPD